MLGFIVVSLNRYNPRRDANEKEIVEYLRKSGCIVDRISGANVPDLLCLSPRGVFFVIEVKTPEGKLKPGQKDWFSLAVDRGALAFVCTGADDVRLALLVVNGG